MGMMLARHRNVDGELELKRLNARLEAIKGLEASLKDEAKALSEKKAEVEKIMKDSKADKVEEPKKEAKAEVKAEAVEEVKEEKPVAKKKASKKVSKKGK